MPKGPHAVLSSPFRLQSADVQKHILDNCNWVLFADGSAVERFDKHRWRILVGAGNAGGEAEEFVDSWLKSHTLRAMGRK
jgi:hypothetical protein